MPIGSLSPASGRKPTSPKRKKKKVKPPTERELLAQAELTANKFQEEHDKDRDEWDQQDRMRWQNDDKLKGFMNREHTIEDLTQQLANAEEKMTLMRETCDLQLKKKDLEYVKLQKELTNAKLDHASEWECVQCVLDENEALKKKVAAFESHHTETKTAVEQTQTLCSKEMELNQAEITMLKMDLATTQQVGQAENRVYKHRAEQLEQELTEARALIAVLHDRVQAIERVGALAAAAENAATPSRNASCTGGGTSTSQPRPHQQQQQQYVFNNSVVSSPSPPALRYGSY